MSIPTRLIPTGATSVTTADYSTSAPGIVTLVVALLAGQPLFRKLFNEYGIVL